MQRLAKELLKLASGVVATEREAKLLDDYGITDGIIAKVEPTFNQIKRLFKAGKYDEIAKINKTFKGILLWVADENKLTPEVEAALRSFKYVIEFGPSVMPTHWSHVSYDPRTKTIWLQYTTNLLQSLKKRGELEGYKGVMHEKHMQNDLNRFDLSVQHEVTHAVRDSITHHLETHIKRYDKDEKVRERYKGDRSHIELEFEIDAEINALARLKRRWGQRKWDLIADHKTLERVAPGTQFPKPGDPMFRKWVKRLIREDLLSNAMRETWHIGTNR